MNDKLCKSLIEYLENYTNKLKHENKSINTIKSYKNTINQFISFISSESDVIELKMLKPSILYRFFDFKENMLEKQGEMSINTKRIILVHIKAFFSFIETESDELLDFTKLFKSFKFKAVKQKPKTLDEDEEKKLLNAIEFKKNEKDDFVSIRDALILKLMLYSGLRISEVISIRFQDFIDTEQGVYSISVIGKGQKQRIVYINKDQIDDEISELLKIKGPKDFLCISKSGVRIPRQNIDKMIKALCVKANIKKISAHKLRHTFSNRYVNELGGNIVHLQEMLGHSDIKTTMIYANPRQEDVKRGYINTICTKNISKS